MSSIAELETFEHESARFDSLMAFRIENILLVSSLYDIYNLREDGQLTDMLLSEYAEFRLSSAPAIRRVDSAASALKALEKSKYELVIVLRTLNDMDPADFSRQARALRPGIPVVLLAFHHRDLERVREHTAPAFDNIFIWNGEPKMLLTIIKLVEDKVNVVADTDQVGVRVIILVENSVRFYSSYLPMLYTEVLEQTQSLMLEGINLSHRLLRMRARPKILLATTFEEAWSWFERYKDSLLGVISDGRFPWAGDLVSNAGVSFIQQVKAADPHMPTVLQSTNEDLRQEARVLVDPAHHLGNALGVEARVAGVLAFGREDQRHVSAYLEALRLWLKKVPIHPHTKPKEAPFAATKQP